MDHVFGGSWTDDKLLKLAKYLRAYRSIFSHGRASYYKTWYVDAFAGTGHRVPSAQVKSAVGDEPAYVEAADYLEGSAKIALGLDSPFDHYLFVEKSRKRAEVLESTIKAEFPSLLSRVRIKQEDANTALCEWCKARDWKKERAVVFLDPYGMQVDWKTVEELATTQAVDLWYLFPLGVARLLTRDGNIDEAWARRLNILFGVEDWKSRFYQTVTNANLFGEYEETVRDATVENIQSFIEERLKTKFAAIAPSLVLRNSKSSPLFAFCFAASNEKGAPIAVKIAKDILKS